eukprot:764783-Hanusia_phi.AAC.1
MEKRPLTDVQFRIGSLGGGRGWVDRGPFTWVGSRRVGPRIIFETSFVWYVRPAAGALAVPRCPRPAARHCPGASDDGAARRAGLTGSARAPGRRAGARPRRRRGPVAVLSHT